MAALRTRLKAHFGLAHLLMLLRGVVLFGAQVEVPQGACRQSALVAGQPKQTIDGVILDVQRYAVSRTDQISGLDGLRKRCDGCKAF